MAYTTSSYISTKKYRDEHRDKYNTYQQKFMLEYQRKHRDIINEKQRNRNSYIRECKIFRNILM